MTVAIPPSTTRGITDLFEVLIDEIADRVRLKLSLERPQPVLRVPKPKSSGQRASKSAVSERMWVSKTPLFLELLLRENSLRLGCSINEVQSTLGISATVVRRMALRMADLNVLQIVKNTGSGGLSSYYKVPRGRTDAAKDLLEQLKAKGRSL